MKRKNSPINIFMLFASLVFFFNPNVIVVDILPDFIGYMLLCGAFLKLSDFNDTIGEAVSGFKKMILVDGAKWLAVMWIFGISSPDERTSSMLLWSTVFCILEMIFAVPAFIKLFSGLSDLGDVLENTSIHGRTRGKRKSYTERIRAFTVIFVSIKAFGAFLPELADFGNVARRMRELGDMLYDPNKVFVNIYDYIGLLRGFAFIVTLVFGIIWLVKTAGYFTRVKKDSAFIDGLSALYSERVESKVGIFVNRYIKTGFFILSAGILLTLDLRLENINAIPDFLGGIFILAFALYMGKRAIANKWALTVISAAYFFATCYSSFAENQFYSNHSFRSVLRNEEAASAFWTMVGATAFCGALLVVFGILLLMLQKQIISEHTGYVFGSLKNTDVEKRQIKEVQAEIFRPVIPSFVALVIYVATDILNSLQAYCYAYFEADFGYFAAINTVAGIVFFALTIKALGEIKDAVEIKYALE